MGAVAALRQTLAELLDDLAPGRVLAFEPDDVLNARSIYLGRPTITSKPTMGVYQVSQPIVFAADGAARSAQDWLDDTTEAAWALLVDAGHLPESVVPAQITIQPRAVDAAAMTAPGAVLTVTAFARPTPAEEP